MRAPLTMLLAALLTCIATAERTAAQVELDASVAMGYGYDSNVSVEEIERPSGEADRFRRIDAQFDVSSTFKGVTGTVTYAYSSNDYEDFDNVSRQTQIWGTSLETNIGKTLIGASYFSADADLADTPFLTYNRFSPYISGFISRRWFLRGAYIDSEKDIVNRPGRSADNKAIEIDAYYFWRGLRRYFNIGYGYEDEDSRANRYDYRAHLFDLRMIQRFDFNDTLGELELEARFETRNYSSITPQIGVPRDDERVRLEAEMTLPLGEHVFWGVFARYGNYISNFDSVDYEDVVIGTQFELRL